MYISSEKSESAKVFVFVCSFTFFEEEISKISVSLQGSLETGQLMVNSPY